MRKLSTLSIASSPYRVYHRKRKHGHNIVSTSVRKQNFSNSLGLFAMLSLDLSLEILYRLPVKSLLILKCVCKPLNSIISDPKFPKDHLRLSQTRHYHLAICPISYSFKREFLLYDYRVPSVFDNSRTSITMLKLPINTYNNDVVIINSCNGIICFETRDWNYNSEVVVCNPSTGKFKILPPLENLPQGTFKTGYNIGYDSFSDNYKVVAVTCYQFNVSYLFFKTQVRIHNSNTNSWKRIADFPSEITGKPDWDKGIFVSGTFNWVLQRHQEIGSSWVILSLDLGNESYEEIPQPNFGLDDPLRYLNLGFFRDCLYVLAHTRDFLDIWVMKDHGNIDSWSKFFNVSFAELGYNGFRFVSLIYISEEDGHVFLDIFEKVYVYNYKNRTSKILELNGLPPTRFTYNVYFESLISP